MLALKPGYLFMTTLFTDERYRSDGHITPVSAWLLRWFAGDKDFAAGSIVGLLARAPVTP